MNYKDWLELGLYPTDYHAHRLEHVTKPFELWHKQRFPFVSVDQKPFRRDGEMTLYVWSSDVQLPAIDFIGFPIGEYPAEQRVKAVHASKQLRLEYLRHVKENIDKEIKSIKSLDQDTSELVSYARFTELLEQKYPYQPKYGMKRALLDWNRKELEAGRTTLKITEGREQKWRRDAFVPRWAYAYLESIAELPCRPEAVTWSDTEIKFLTRLIHQRSQLSYVEMAAICSKRFGREVGENAIKGASDRLNIGKFDISQGASARAPHTPVSVRSR
jgi:hypothetical protein